MRVSEVYASTQGEGPNVGRTTVFVRYGGCNLRCPGWPCDTQHAIDPVYRNEWTRNDVHQLLQRTTECAELAGARLITLTGGEPFLQNHGSLEQFVSTLTGRGYKVEAFTNGTILYPEWAVEEVSMIMDWKLPGSGEDCFNETRLENVKRLDEASIWHSTKFVIKDMYDFQMAVDLWQKFIDGPGRALNVFYGKVWDGKLSDAELVELVMRNRLPWRLNRQEHNYIWPPNERGR